jgi:hypothetical protein
MESARLLVCGSERFQDRAFVFATLDAFCARLRLGAVISGPFAGADQLARDWAETRGVAHEALELSADDMRLHRFFDTRPIPASVLRQDPMTLRGARRLLDLGVHAVLALPRPSGQLGSTATNLIYMAGVAEIPHFNGSEAFARAHAALERGAPARSRRSARP